MRLILHTAAGSRSRCVWAIPILRDLPGRIANAAPVGNIYSPFCCFRAMGYFTILEEPVTFIKVQISFE
jgi:hypothetical protein